MVAAVRTLVLGCAAAAVAILCLGYSRRVVVRGHHGTLEYSDK